MGQNLGKTPEGAMVVGLQVATIPSSNPHGCIPGGFLLDGRRAQKAVPVQVPPAGTRHKRRTFLMEILLQQIINGLVLGSMYALIALGYTMVYGIIQLINFAHGEVLS